MDLGTQGGIETDRPADPNKALRGDVESKELEGEDGGLSGPDELDRLSGGHMRLSKRDCARAEQRLKTSAWGRHPVGTTKKLSITTGQLNRIC
jgi:hypothetical protein